MICAITCDGTHGLPGRYSELVSPDRRLLWEVAPEFAAELKIGLASDGLSTLAGQVETLRIWARCRCDDRFCSSFYTGPPPNGAWSDLGEHANVMPSVAMGMVILDVVDDTIRFVEVLDRPKLAPVIESAVDGEDP